MGEQVSTEDQLSRRYREGDSGDVVMREGDPVSSAYLGELNESVGVVQSYRALGVRALGEQDCRVAGTVSEVDHQIGGMFDRV